MKSLFLRSTVLLLTLSVFTPANALQPTSLKACEVGKPKCVEFVIKEMERRYKPLAKQCDHDALKALIYLRTTETFIETLDEVDYDKPASVIREDALFAEYYFRAYDAYHSGMGNLPPAWRTAFDAASRRFVSGRNKFKSNTVHTVAFASGFWTVIKHMT